MFRSFTMNKIVVLLLGLTLIIIYSSCGDVSSNNDNSSDPQVAVYNGPGVMETSAQAMLELLDDWGYNAALASSEEIQSSLEHTQLIIFPAGDPATIMQFLGATGIQRMQSHVRTGGSYLGIGAGAYIASESFLKKPSVTVHDGLQLYVGTANGPIEEIPLSSATVVSMTEADNRFNPDLITSFRVPYLDGPAFSFTNPASPGKAGTYLTGTHNAAVFFGRDAGRVVLVSAQPEFSFDNLPDELNIDQDSVDWNASHRWLKAMVAWCLFETI